MKDTNSLNRDWEENRIQDVEVRYNSFVKPMFKIKDKLESDFIDEQTLSFVKMEIKNATYYAEKRERKRCLEEAKESGEDWFALHYTPADEDTGLFEGIQEYMGPKEFNNLLDQAISAISNKK